MEKKSKKLLITHLKEYRKYMAATKSSAELKKRALTNPKVMVLMNKNLDEIDYLIKIVKEIN